MITHLMMTEMMTGRTMTGSMMTSMTSMMTGRMTGSQRSLLMAEAAATAEAVMVEAATVEAMAEAATVEAMAEAATAEATVGMVEATVEMVEATVEMVEATVEMVEATVGIVEAAMTKSRTHSLYSSQETELKKGSPSTLQFIYHENGLFCMLHVFCLAFSCEIFSEFSRLHVFCSEKLILHVEFVVNRCEFNKR